MPNARPPRKSRISQLDATRGIAALSVLLFHCLLVIRNSNTANWLDPGTLTTTLNWSPLRLLWVGHAAVVLFFVLSGFVLYLMLERAQSGYYRYALRRIVRLYLPYLVAVVLGVGGTVFLYNGHLPGLNHWINKFWSWPVSNSSLMHTLFAVDTFNSDRYDFTIWSLVHEIRISLIFPLLFVVVRRFRWWQALLPFVLLSAAAVALRYGVFGGSLDFHGWLSAGGLNAYPLTAHYTLAFVVGAVLAKNRDPIGHWYTQLPGLSRAALGMLALGLYIYSDPLVSLVPTSIMAFADWPIMAGAALGMVILISEPVVIRCLDRQPFLHLGAVSYSLYLFHPLVLLAALHLLYPELPLAVVLALVIPAALLVADLAYRGIERPAVRLSRLLGKKKSPKPA